MIKTDDVHLKGEIINWAKQQNYDQKETLEKWVEIRNKYKGIPESNEKDLQCYQELVTEMQSKNANIFAGRPAVPVEGYIIGASEPWLKNESNINNLMKQYNSGNIPVDKDNRPLIAVRDGVPIPIAYNRNGGTYDLKAKKEVKFAFYGAPENQTSMIIEVTVSGEVTNSLGVKEWFADHIGEIPLNKKVRMNVDVTEYGTYMHKTPIIEGQFFEVLEYESGKTIIDVFDEISGTNDFVEFEDIEDYAEDFPYILFLSEGTVINIGSPSSTGNVALSIGQSVKVLFGKVASEPVVGWVSEDMIKRSNVKKGDKVRFVAKSWYDRNGNFKVSIMNVIGNTEPEMSLFTEERKPTLTELLDEELVVEDGDDTLNLF